MGGRPRLANRGRETSRPPDTYHNIRTATVVDTGRHLVVFDTGDGPQPAGATTGRMMENLRAAGIDPAA